MSQAGGFMKKTVHDMDLHGKTVLVRADYNVPLDDKQEITSDYRITQSVPTIEYLRQQKCKVIVMSHLGRPKSHDPSKSLKPVAKRLSSLLKAPVTFVADTIGEKVKTAAKDMNPGDVLLLENVRFYSAEEKSGDENFAKAIVEATNADIFVQDCFGAAHRAHASVVGPAKLLPSCAGLLLEKEVATITKAMHDPERPLMAVIGGAKISDKIDIIDVFLQKADVVVVGGAMANTFMKALGNEIGESLSDDEEINDAHDIIERARAEMKKRSFTFYLPQDAVVTDEIDKSEPTRIVDWEAHAIASIESYPGQPSVFAERVKKSEKIVDIGPVSGSFIAGMMQQMATVVWNGTMGIAEFKGVQGKVGPYAHGTEFVIDGLIGKHGHVPFSIVGGGDTTAYIDSRGMNDMFNHVSTGGGASLELMSGKKLPGVECLEDKG